MMALRTQSVADRRRPLALRDAEAMLAYIDGAEDRETWLAVGMGLKDEFGDAAFDAWDRWSAQAHNYDAKACRASWRGFRASAGHGYTIATVIKLAKDGGFRFDSAPPPAEALAEVARRRAERERRLQTERAQRAAAVATAQQRARDTWAAASRTGSSPYCQRKGIERPESIRYTADGGIVIPMLRYDQPREHALKGVQIIAADGTKRFTYGMEKPGTACRLGLVSVGDPIFIAEGWATASSIRAALDWRFPVFVAFDAYNLPVVTEIVWGMYPTCPLVICADDDHATTRNGLPWNTGRIQAQVAMDSVMDAGARLVVRTHPAFLPATPRTPGDTDFNDLHRLEGLAAVREAMQVALECIEELRRHA